MLFGITLSVAFFVCFMAGAGFVFFLYETTPQECPAITCTLADKTETVKIPKDQWKFIGDFVIP